MGAYSLVDFEEIKEIISYYNLGKVKSFEATIEGISNSNYKVMLESGEKVLLKISNDKTLEQLTHEQEILETLTKYHFPFCLAPLKSIKGRLIYEHNGMYGVIFPYIDGRPPLINESSLSQIGSALGTLHSLEIYKEDLGVLRAHDLVGYGGQSINDYILGENAVKDFVENFCQIFPDRLSNVPYDLFPSGIIHGDLYYDNSLFDEEKLVTLIDFEQSGRGRFILDIGIALSGSCLNAEKTNLSLSLINSFLNGYEKQRKLLVIERQYLRTAIAVGFFSIALWRIKRFYEGNLDERKRYNYRELLSRCKEFWKTSSENDFQMVS